MCSSGRGGWQWWVWVSQPKINLLRDSVRNEGAGLPVLDVVCVEYNLLYQLTGLIGNATAWSFLVVRVIPLAVN